MQNKVDTSAPPVNVPSWLPDRRALLWAFGVAFAFAVGIRPFVRNTFLEVLAETVFVTLMLLLAFRAAGHWHSLNPQRPQPLWVVQVVAVGLAAFVAPLLVQMVTVGGNISLFLQSRPLRGGYAIVAFVAAISGVIIALAALYRERDAQARALALQFELTRQTLEREAADARLQLLTAQIKPHFLLNTLANVQALVESGSPDAVPLFRHLIAYLRASMPQLQRENPNLGDEEKLVRAYLALMQMRMPDRLQFTIEIEPNLLTTPLPAMALLTLIENAIQHGIDPASNGGSIDVGARHHADGQVQMWVTDTGVGMAGHAEFGKGLTNLQRRMAAFFGPSARLELSEHLSQGVHAELWFTPQNSNA